MRAQEFILESKTASAESVWNYVKKIHPADQQGGEFLEQLIKQYSNYKLQSVPLASLIIHDQESDDPDEEPEEDPYGRVQVVDPEYAGEVSVHNLDRNPIVIDDRGHILDGNHRAWAAAELLDRDTIQAWVPVKGNIDEDLYQPGGSQHRIKIQQAMKKAGYREIGDGVDSTVYSKDAGTVIKIIVPMFGDFAPADKTFLTWYKFCQQHAGNPHLPQFQEIAGQHHATFTIDGEQFRQIAMEKLKPMPEESKLSTAIYRMAMTIQSNIVNSRNNSPRQWMTADFNSYYAPGESIQPYVIQGLKQDIQFIEKIMSKYPELYKTLNAVIRAGKRAGLRDDMISDGNIMRRADGTPVIIDPWVDNTK